MILSPNLLQVVVSKGYGVALSGKWKILLFDGETVLAESKVFGFE